MLGFVVTLVLNAFVLDKYNAYGEVPVPASGNLHIPAGEVTVSFHTEVIGSPSGGGLPLPPLGLDIEPPAGVPNPIVTESVNSATTVNNDPRRRVWLVRLPVTGVRAPKCLRLFGLGIRRAVHGGSAQRDLRTVVADAQPPEITPSDRGARVEQLKPCGTARTGGADGSGVRRNAESLGGH